jgi:hypothetical protein
VHRSRRFRLSALLAGGAVIAASLLPALPALAEEPPTPDPVVTSEPVESPTPEATDAPAPDPTDTPAAEPTNEPTPDATPTEAPVVEAPAPATGGVEYAGEFAGLPDESGADSSSTGGLFQVPGYGFLSIDTAGLSPMATLGTKVVTFAVPDGVTLSGSAHSRFTQLATASVKNPLTVLSIRVGLSLGKQTASLVNQTPVASATHRIYAVLVSPGNRSKAANQTAAKVQTSVDHADEYWDQQSGGNVRFDLVGTTKWYKSSYSCKSNSGSESLWNQAASVAKSQLGYVAGKNNHLVLFFPSDDSDTECNGNIGLGSIGDSVNSGGVAWVVGTDADIEQASLAHELGHNLSLGHADWLDCTATNPVGGVLGFGGATSCTKHNYGDEIDVMGFGNAGRTGGALSSPQAIRSGMWGPESPTSWQTVTATGTPQSFTLQPVSGNTGRRAIVVQDDDGVNYFVEYRIFDDEDAQYATMGCTASACVEASHGVRILRLENNAYKWNPSQVPNGFLGFPGDDSLLIGHDNAGRQGNFTAGETYWTQAASSGIKIQVISVTATDATVEITKTANSATGDVGFIWPTSAHDSQMRVGDTWTMMAGSRWDAQTTTFQWYSWVPGGSSTPTGTGQNYVLRASDVDRYVWVRMTGVSSTGGPITADSGPYGPIVKGVYEVDQPGDVVVQNSDPFHAATSNWPSGTSFTYQWYRGSTAKTATTAISGATHQDYAGDPKADYYKFLRVRVTATIPGYSGTTKRYSSAYDFTVHNNVKPVLSSTREIGTELTADTSGFVYTASDGGPLVGLTPTYQWLRDGVAISGADASDDADYTLQSADYGKKISVRVTSSKPGFIANVVTSTSITPNVKGHFVSGDAPLVQILTPRVLTVQPSLTADIEPDATSFTIQWYRGTSKITGATKTSYKLTSSDFGKEVTAKVTYLKSNYTSKVVTAYAGGDGLGYDYTSNWWLRDDTGLPRITGNPAVGQVLTVPENSYTDMHQGYATCGGSCMQFTYQWLRNGTPITTADATDNDGDYQLTSADKGKAISVKVTVLPVIAIWLLPNIQTSAKTQLIGEDYFPDWTDAATATLSGQVLTAHSGVDDPLATSTYQWYRDDTAIPGETHDTHTLVDADHDPTVWVKVTTKRAGFTTAITTSTRVHYGLYGPSDAYNVRPMFGAFGDPMHVDDVLTTTRPGNASGTFFNYDHSFSPPDGGLTRTYLWYRNGTLISGLDPSNQNYQLQAADLGKTIKVVIRVHFPGLVDYVRTSTTASASQKVLPGPLDVGSYHPVVGVSSSNVAKVTMTGTPTVPLPYTLTYKWLRNGVAISGQTTSSYTLATSDSNRDITVVVKATKGAYEYTYAPVQANALTKTGTSTIQQLGGLTYGEQLQVNPATWTAGSGAVASRHYQWMREGVAITGETGSTYTIAPADENMDITVLVTATLSRYKTATETTAAVHVPS